MEHREWDFSSLVFFRECGNFRDFQCDDGNYVASGIDSFSFFEVGAHREQRDQKLGNVSGGGLGFSGFQRDFLAFDLEMFEVFFNPIFADCLSTDFSSLDRFAEGLDSLRRTQQRF